MKILFRNLARITTEAELKSLFEAHGTVESCTLVLDRETGLSKGFGFAEMPNEDEANAAISALNGSSVGNSKIRVKEAEEV